MIKPADVASAIGAGHDDRAFLQLSEPPVKAARSSRRRRLSPVPDIRQRLAAVEWHALFRVAAVGAVIGYVAALAMQFAQHNWIFGPNGRPMASDFLAYWAAGKTILTQGPTAVYDINVEHAVQTSIAGSFPRFLYWNYPPVFHFVAVLLASMSFPVAYVSWVTLTAAVYAVTIGVVIRRWEGALAALASPITLLSAYVGQNGFLTAALFGGFLHLLPRRPIVSGVLLGLLTYKPQFGVLIPLALIVDRRWLTLGSAAITTILLVGASVLFFGPASYSAFLHALPVISNASLTSGGEAWQKIQSVYSAARFFGAGNQAAWFVQAMMIAFGAGSVVALRKVQCSFAIQAAALIVAAMLSTPYLHEYDFPLLIVPLAFLYRDRPFDGFEWSIAIVVNLLMAMFLLQLAPVGVMAMALVAAIIIRRLLAMPASENGTDRPVSTDSEPASELRYQGAAFG